MTETISSPAQAKVDRRQRLLFPTLHGEALALDVARLQSKRFARVFAHLPQGSRARASEFLLALVNEGAAKSRSGGRRGSLRADSRGTALAANFRFDSGPSPRCGR